MDFFKNILFGDSPSSPKTPGKGTWKVHELRKLPEENLKSRQINLYIHSLNSMREHLPKLHQQLNARVLSVANSKGISINIVDFKYPKRRALGDEAKELCAQSLICAYKCHYFIGLFDDTWREEELPRLDSYKGALSYEYPISIFQSQQHKSLEGYLKALSISKTASKAFLGFYSKQNRGSQSHRATEVPHGFSTIPVDNIDDLIDMIVSHVCISLDMDFDKVDAFTSTGYLYSSYLKKMQSLYQIEKKFTLGLVEEIKQSSEDPKTTPVFLLEGDHASFSSSMMGCISDELSGVIPKRYLILHVCLAVHEGEWKQDNILSYIAHRCLVELEAAKQSELEKKKLERKESSPSRPQMNAQIHVMKWHYIQELLTQLNKFGIIFIHGIDQICPSSLSKEPQSLDWIPQDLKNIAFVLSRPSTFIRRTPLVANLKISLHKVAPIPDNSLEKAIQKRISDAGYLLSGDTIRGTIPKISPASRHLIDLQLDILLNLSEDENDNFKAKFEAIMSWSLQQLMTRYIESWTKLFGGVVSSLLYLLAISHVGIRNSILKKSEADSTESEKKSSSVRPEFQEINDIMPTFIPFIGSFLFASQKRTQFRSPIIANVVEQILRSRVAGDKLIAAYLSEVLSLWKKSTSQKTASEEHTPQKSAPKIEILVLSLKTDNYELFINKVTEFGFTDECAEYFINNEWSLCLQGFLRMNRTMPVSNFMKKAKGNSAFWSKIITLVYEIEGLESAMRLLADVNESSSQWIRDIWRIRHVYKSEKYDEAVQKIDELLHALESPPKEALSKEVKSEEAINAVLSEGYNLRGCFNHKMGRVTEATADFKKAYEYVLKTDSLESILPVLLNSAACSVEGAARTLDSVALLNECREKISLLRSKSSVHEGRYHYIQGIRLYRNAQYAEALSSYETALSIFTVKFNHPRYTSVIRCSMAECYERLGRRSDSKMNARTAKDEAATYDKTSLDFARISIAFACSIMNDSHQEAFASLKEALSILEKANQGYTEEAIICKCNLAVLNTKLNTLKAKESLATIQKLSSECKEKGILSRPTIESRIEEAKFLVYVEALCSPRSEKDWADFQPIIEQAFESAKNVKSVRKTAFTQQPIDQLTLEIFIHVAVCTYNEFIGELETEQGRKKILEAPYMQRIKEVLTYLDFAIQNHTNCRIDNSIILLGLRAMGLFNLETIEGCTKNKAVTYLWRIVEMSKSTKVSDSILADVHEAIGRAYLELEPAPKYTSAWNEFKNAKKYAESSRADAKVISAISSCIRYAEYMKELQTPGP